MILLLGSALAQWPTFEPPSTAPSFSPWELERYELGIGVVTGLGGDGTTITDTDIPGPGWLDGFADVQISGQARLNDRSELIFTGFMGTGSAFGGGIGVRTWMARSELGGIAVQADAGLLYGRVAVPMVVHLDHISLYCAPTGQLAFGAQIRTPFGVIIRPTGLDGVSIALETGLAITAQESWPPNWQEGTKYFGAVTVSQRFGAPAPKADSPWS